MLSQEGGTSVIVDTGVYTRNRAFRLYLSSKAGKSSILIPTGSSPILAVECMLETSHDMVKTPVR